MFAILKKLAEKGEQITASGVLETLQDGFGVLRAMESNYLPGPDDIYVSPSQIRRFGLRKGDTVEGEIRAPKDQERYFALLKVNKINFEDPEKKEVYFYFVSGYPTTMIVPHQMEKYYPNDWTGHIVSKEYLERLKRDKEKP